MEKVTQMGKNTEITRIIEVDDKTIHLHIHLTEEEIRRLLLPHVVDAFATELRQRTRVIYPTFSDHTTPIEVEGKP